MTNSPAAETFSLQNTWKLRSGLLVTARSHDYDANSCCTGRRRHHVAQGHEQTYRRPPHHEDESARSARRHAEIVQPFTTSYHAIIILQMKSQELRASALPPSFCGAGRTIDAAVKICESNLVSPDLKARPDAGSELEVGRRSVLGFFDITLMTL